VIGSPISPEQTFFEKQEHLLGATHRTTTRSRATLEKEHGSANPAVVRVAVEGKVEGAVDGV